MACPVGYFQKKGSQKLFLHGDCSCLVIFFRGGGGGVALLNHPPVTRAAGVPIAFMRRPFNIYFPKN